ncbi:head-tail adaptor protein [Paracoccus denitrificans]|uniref:phage head completion protein n=1 Tax=Paracoccus denitrificans TaxID=266 RepID=UPI001E435E85|nr:head-tail adaptor protein [Paracoccus denitrificans]UFS64392.1 head-tail adaptor protein [Paracoccus denitrificans]
MAVLDHRIQFRRGTVADDDFSTDLRWNAQDPAADDLGLPVWAGRTDGAEAEGAAAGGIEATMVSRFVVRSSPFTRSITPKDRLVEGGLVFDIVGIRQIGLRNALEITAKARTD